jgi:hypothetical protein
MPTSTTNRKVLAIPAHDTWTDDAIDVGFASTEDYGGTCDFYDATDASGIYGMDLDGHGVIAITVVPTT